MTAERSKTPDDIGSSTPSALSPASAQTRQLIEHLEASLKDVKDDVKEIRKATQSDFRMVIGFIGAGVVALATMLFAGYFRLDDGVNNVEEQVRSVVESNIRMEGRIERVLDRLPPLTPPQPPTTPQAPAPRP